MVLGRRTRPDTAINGLLLGVVLGFLAYYGLPVLPAIGTLGQTLVDFMNSIGQALAGAIKQEAGSFIYDNAGVVFTVLIGAIVGYYTDIT